MSGKRNFRKWCFLSLFFSEQIEEPNGSNSSLTATKDIGLAFRKKRSVLSKSFFFNKGLEPNEHCDSHQGPGHFTERCWQLKQKIQDWIDAGILVDLCHNSPAQVSSRIRFPVLKGDFLKWFLLPFNKKT